jgi:hypothetical protein
METKMTRASKDKRGQKQKSTPRQALTQSRRNVESGLKNRAGGIPILPNMRDHLVVQTLRTTPFGELAVDGFMLDESQTKTARRDFLIGTYCAAAKARVSSKATKRQLIYARSALSQSTKAIENLAKVSSDGRDGLRMALEGPPLDDERGERELNELASACWKIRLEIARSAVCLEAAIQHEEEKPTKAGERRKRLRTLVEALADQWLSLGGSLAPTVDANRRDDGPAIVHGRHGRFLALAVALFCEVDVFTEAEVEAAVTNVHEKWLARAKSTGRN